MATDRDPIVQRADGLRRRVVGVARAVANAARGGRLDGDLATSVLDELSTVAGSLDELAGGTRATRAVGAAQKRIVPTTAPDAETPAVASPEPATSPETPADAPAGAPARPKRPGRKSERKGGKRRRVTHLAIDDIRTDPARFQPRGAAFSEESAQRVADEFDANLFEPVVVWTDPADGQPYVLAGHSRLEGFRRRAAADDSVTTIPVRYFSGDEAAARRFAATENDKGTAMQNHERAAYLRGLRADGKTEAQIKREADRLYKRDATTVVALSRLSETGKAVAAVRALRAGTDEGRDAETMATWLGKLRAQFPQLTDAHEGELFGWLLENYKTKGKRVRSYTQFGEWAAPRIDRRTEFGRVDGPLNLNDLPAASRTELGVDEAIRAAERELADAERTLKRKRENYIGRGGSAADVERATHSDREAVAVATRDLLALRQSRAGTIAAIRGSEMSLFGNAADALAAFRACGLVRGTISAALAYLGRVVYLSVSAPTEDGGMVYDYFEDDRGTTQLLYDPADATLYLVPDALVVPALGEPDADRDGWPDAVDGGVEQLAAEGIQAGFHGFVPGRVAFRVDWPEADTAVPLGTATRIRYLSDKLHEAAALPGGPLPAGTMTTGRKGVNRGFEHLFTSDTLPALMVGEGESAVLAVRGVLVTDDGLIN